MKTCGKCNVEKDEIEFAKRYDKLQSYCKACNRQQRKDHYRANRQRSIDYSLNNKWKLRRKALEFVMDYVQQRGGCACGEQHFACIEFDHRDPATKCHNVSELITGGYSLKRISEELEKCDIVCANCHRKRTAIQFSWYTNVLSLSSNG